MAAQFKVEIMADSLNPYTGKRLTTFNLRYPRVVHAEVMTHRVFARNAESSRARPVVSILEQIEQEPYIPIKWGQNQKGMSAGEPVSLGQALDAEKIWLEAMRDATKHARALNKLGIHKQWVNRIVEPYTHISVVLSSTEWDNFFELRCDEPTVMPEFYTLACLMRARMAESHPVQRLLHIPFVTPEELVEWEEAYACEVAVGRLARVSYLTHEGIRDPEKDVQLFYDLLDNKHMSPFEHVACATMPGVGNRGCFQEWRQFRQEVEDGNILRLWQSTTQSQGRNNSIRVIRRWPRRLAALYSGFLSDVVLPNMLPTHN